MNIISKSLVNECTYIYVSQLEPINRTDLLAREFHIIYSSHLSSLCSPFFTPFTIHNRIFYIRNLDYMKIDISRL